LLHFDFESAIYKGPGVSEECFKHTHQSINKALSASYCIKSILPHQVISSSWEENAILFILPGGRDIPYAAALNGAGNQKIRTFIEKGGSFLGICAGGYYAGDFVDFGKDSPLSIQEKRELSLFSGTVKGPVLAPYDYFSNSGVRSAKLIWEGDSDFSNQDSFSIYYNGGGYFVDALEKTGVSVLASYNLEIKLPAIIKCRIGLGIAILSGVHFEFDPTILDTKDTHLQSIIPELIASNNCRVLILKNLLKSLTETEDK